MTKIQYFIRTDDPDSVERGKGALLRLEEGEPWALAEAIVADGTWETMDLLARYHLLGSNDIPISETTAERARNILVTWHRLGRLSALPNPLPGEDDAINLGRSAEAEAEREDLRPRAQIVQDGIVQIWSQVNAPPNAESIGPS
jgi:hypothetical protein